MAIVLKVKWVDQSAEPEPYKRIRIIGGASGQLHWKHTHAEAVEAVERGLFAYYIERNARPVRLEITMAPDGGKYLATTQFDELLDLPGFPNCGSDGAIKRQVSV